jgi:hypothetical protein
MKITNKQKKRLGATKHGKPEARNWQCFLKEKDENFKSYPISYSLDIDYASKN